MILFLLILILAAIVVLPFLVTGGLFAKAVNEHTKAQEAVDEINRERVARGQDPVVLVETGSDVVWVNDGSSAYPVQILD